MYKILNVNILDFSCNMVLEFINNIIMVIKKRLNINYSVKKNLISNNNINDFEDIKIEVRKLIKNISYTGAKQS